MAPYKLSFIEMALKASALQFGEFTLKSGRISPYFFNISTFCSGSQLTTVGQCYREAIKDSGIQFNGLFGPAYKGIPLAISAACAYAEQGIDIPVSFNRKEPKNHGERGALIGTELTGNILAVDDVVTAGTAIRESVEFVENHGARLVAFCVALDRQERAQAGTFSALAELTLKFGLQPVSIISLDDILEFATKDSRIPKAIVGSIEAYRADYGT